MKSRHNKNVRLKDCPVTGRGRIGGEVTHICYIGKIKRHYGVKVEDESADTIDMRFTRLLISYRV